jgi:hypothetical protein
VPPLSAITFDANGPITDGITHIPTHSFINFLDAGTYKISLDVSTSLSGYQLSLELNAAVVPQATFATTTTQLSDHAIITVNAGDVLTIVNTAGSTNLASGAPVNALVTIEQLGATAP